MEDAQVTHLEGEHVAFKRLLWAAPLAAIAAAVANAVVYFVASVLGAMPQDFVVQGSGTDNANTGRPLFLDRGSRSRNGLHGRRFAVAATDTDLPHCGGGGAGAVIRDAAHHPRGAALDDPDAGAYARGCRGDHHRHAYGARPRKVVPVEA